MILTVTLNPAVDFVVFGKGFTVGTTNRGDDIPPDPGGKGINCARIARLLGCEVMTTGILGGFTGDFIEQGLRSEGIVTAFQPSSRPTRITVSYVDTGTLAQTKIVPSGPIVEPVEMDAFCEHFDRLLSANSFSMVSMNGSVGRGMAPDIYARLTGICAAREVGVFLDTSGSALAASVLGCRGPEGKRAAAPEVIKPNIDEARMLCGAGSQDPLPLVLDRIRPVLASVPVIALTLGVEGALLLTRDRCLKGEVPDVAAVNPICAGDAFVGGFLAAHDSGKDDIETCLRWALAAGTATACVEGLLWDRSMFDAMLARARITRVG